MSVSDQELFKRACSVTVDTLKITDLRIAFRVEKTLKPTPNTCEINIWNLTDSQRSQLEELGQKPALKIPGLGAAPAAKGIPVSIEAGYVDERGTSQIWLGQLRFATSVRDGADIITTLSTGDGHKAYQGSRVAVSFGPKTQVDTALRAIVRALGVGEGNVATVAARLRFSGAAKLLTQGVTISGSAARQLTEWTRSADLEWSIIDGAVQILDRGKVLAGTAVRVSSDTGMLGTPSVDSEGVLTVQMLITPNVRPGSLLLLDAERVKGGYRILKATWDGDTRGDAWTVTAECSRY